MLFSIERDGVESFIDAKRVTFTLKASSSDPERRWVILPCTYNPNQLGTFQLEVCHTSESRACNGIVLLYRYLAQQESAWSLSMPVHAISMGHGMGLQQPVTKGQLGL